MCGASLPCSVRDCLPLLIITFLALSAWAPCWHEDHLSLLAGACAAVLSDRMRRTSSKTQHAMHQAQPASTALGGRTGIPAVSAAAWTGRMRTTSPAAGSPASSHVDKHMAGSGRSVRRQRCNTRSSELTPALSLAVAALLGSVWACAVLPFCRRLGTMLDPARCPDRCWQAVVLPALAVGPIFGCLAFVAGMVVLQSCSMTAWTSLICSAVGAAAATAVSGPANPAGASKLQPTQGAYLMRCRSPIGYTS